MLKALRKNKIGPEQVLGIKGFLFTFSTSVQVFICCATEIQMSKFSYMTMVAVTIQRLMKCYQRDNGDNVIMLRTIKKKENNKKYAFRNDRGIITIDPLDNGRIRKEHCEQLYAHKFNNSDEMDQFLE